MKRILKFMLLPVFVGASSVTVIACNSNNDQGSNQDIINSAASKMQDHMFDMTKLGLTEIPPENTKYNTLAVTARNKITSYYSNLVKTDLNWDYPTVAVQIIGDSSTFLRYYGPDVESRIELTAKLTYKDLTANKNIIIKINNDTTDDQQKIDAIGTILTDYLRQSNLVVPFKTLFKDNLVSNSEEAKYVYSNIEAALRDNLFNSSKENPIPVIDVEGIKIFIRPSDLNSSNIIYNLDSSAIDSNKKTINGTLQNLIVRIYYQSGFYYEMKIESLKIAQSFSDINNQLSHILNQGPQPLQFNISNLPKDGQTLSDYDSDESFRNTVKEELFSYISKVYPTAKMKGSDSWNASKIKIENAASSPFYKDKDDEKRGYFEINVLFSFKVNNIEGEPEIVSPLVSNLKLNLNSL